MLMEAPKDIVDVVKRNYMSWRVAQRYARYFVKDKEPIPTEAVRLEYVAERKQERREYCTCVVSNLVLYSLSLTVAVVWHALYRCSTPHVVYCRPLFPRQLRKNDQSSL